MSDTIFPPEILWSDLFTRISMSVCGRIAVNSSRFVNYREEGIRL